MDTFNLSLGPILLSTLLALFFYGILIIQCYVYHLHYQSDRNVIKLVVAFLLFCDTVSTVFDIQMAYDYFVANYGNTDEIMGFNDGGHAFFATLSITAAVVQYFYAWRIFLFTKKRWLAVIICLAAGITFLAGIGVTIAVRRVHLFSLVSSDLRPIILIWWLSSVVTDVLITVSLVWYLRKSRTGLAGTDGMLARLIRLTIQTGLVTTTAVIGATIAYMVSTSTIYLGFAVVASKLYSNTMMSTLTMRTAWGAGDLTSKQTTSSSSLSKNTRVPGPSTENQLRRETLGMVSYPPSMDGNDYDRRDNDSEIGIGPQVLDLKTDI